MISCGWLANLNVKSIINYYVVACVYLSMKPVSQLCVNLEKRNASREKYGWPLAVAGSWLGWLSAGCG